MDTSPTLPFSRFPKSPTHRPDAPWTQASELRGRNYIDLAIAFKQDFPIGSLLSADALDQWASAHEQYVIPDTTDKKSDAWMALTQRRHHFRLGLNKAAAHPRMNDADAPGAYFLALLTKQDKGLYKVQEPIERIATSDHTVRAANFVTKLHQDLEYVLQSLDWTRLPEWWQHFVKAFYMDCANYKRRVVSDSGDLKEKQRYLASSLQDAVDRGIISPIDGGIHRLLASRHIGETMPDMAPAQNASSSFC